MNLLSIFMLYNKQLNKIKSLRQNIIIYRFTNKKVKIFHNLKIKVKKHKFIKIIKIFLEIFKLSKTKTNNQSSLTLIIIKVKITPLLWQLQMPKIINLGIIHNFKIKKNLRQILIKCNLIIKSLLKQVQIIKPRRVSININISLIKFNNIFYRSKKVYMFQWMIMKIKGKIIFKLFLRINRNSRKHFLRIK